MVDPQPDATRHGTRRESARRWLRRLTAPPVVVLAALLLLFEDVIWAGIERLMHRLAAWPPIHRVEERVAASHPYVILALFGLSVGFFYPLYGVAGYLMVAGHPTGGLVLLIVLKTFGMAFAVRLFAVGRVKLMTIPLFVLLYRGFLALKGFVYGLVTRHPAWRWTAERLRALRAVLRARWQETGGGGRPPTATL
jgi:hypothetical protein